MILPFFPVSLSDFCTCFSVLYFTTLKAANPMCRLWSQLADCCERNRSKCWSHMHQGKSGVSPCQLQARRFKLVACLNFVTFSVVCGFCFPCFVKRDTGTKEWGLISLKLKLRRVMRWERWFCLAPWDFWLCWLSSCCNRLRVPLCLPYLFAHCGLWESSTQEDIIVMSSSKKSAAASSIKRRGEHFHVFQPICTQNTLLYLG